MEIYIVYTEAKDNICSSLAIFMDEKYKKQVGYTFYGGDAELIINMLKGKYKIIVRGGK